MMIAVKMPVRVAGSRLLKPNAKLVDGLDARSAASPQVLRWEFRPFCLSGQAGQGMLQRFCILALNKPCREFESNRSSLG
jgi:hypothetical protein